MIMDLVVIAIIIISALMGAKKGFALTIISFAQWFICIIVGIIFCPTVKGLIVDNTTLDETISDFISKHITDSIGGSANFDSMPNLIGGPLESGTNSLAKSSADSMTGIILSVISFLLIIIIIKIVCYLLSRAFSKKYHHGVIGFFDGVGGFIVGFFRGGVLVYIAFAILVLVMGIVSSDTSTLITKSLNQSYIAGEIYNNNIILSLIKNIFS